MRCEPGIGVLYDSVLFFHCMVGAVEGRQIYVFAAYPGWIYSILIKTVRMAGRGRSSFAITILYGGLGRGNS